MAATSELTYALVLHAVAKFRVETDAMITIRPFAQLVIGYRVKEVWYVVFAHVDRIFCVGCQFEIG